MTTYTVFYHDNIDKREMFNQEFRNCTPHIPQLNSTVYFFSRNWRVMSVTMMPLDHYWVVHLADLSI